MLIWSIYKLRIKQFICCNIIISTIVLYQCYNNLYIQKAKCNKISSYLKLIRLWAQVLYHKRARKIARMQIENTFVFPIELISGVIVILICVLAIIIVCLYKLSLHQI